ncbi:MAG: hypothetical protein E7605_06135 [Ruminococcaceae bacterium]|nr:hypothetical protein [Oscillospiraceae bacterium]
MKKYLSMLLATLMVLTALLSLIACSNPDDIPETPKDPTTDPGTTEKPNEGGQERIPLTFPQKSYDFQNASYNILEWACGGQDTAGDSWIPWEEGDVDQLDGGMLSGAVFARNAWVEEEFGVSITKEYVSVEVKISHIYRMRQNRDTSANEFQLVTQRSRNLITMVQENLMFDMNTLAGTILHTDQPWWVQNSIDSYTLGAHLYVASTEMLLRDKGATAALYFNQAIAEDSDLPNFFDLVDDHQWTFANMIAACEIVSTSADGDDLMNSATDMWGCIGGDDPVFFLYASTGRQFAHIDEGGYMEYDFGYDEDSITVMQEIFEDFMYADWYLNTAVDKAILEPYEGKVFPDGHALFSGGMVKSVNDLNEMQEMYGILPYPKYDEDQDDYSSLVWIHHDSILGIPADVADAEMCAVILEALSWESYYSVYPIFYDTILLDRAAKDADSKRMLQLIFQTRIYDPGQYWDTTTGLQHAAGLLRLTSRDSSDIMSVWKMYEGKIEECVKDINKMISDMEE